MKEIKSYYGQILGIIFSKFVFEHQYIDVANTKDELQQQIFDVVLFSAIVSEFEQLDNLTSCNITFTDENGIIKVLHLSIHNNVLFNETEINISR
jgi:hypothetical protein